MQIVSITNSEGRVVEVEWLARAEAVHRQLRSALPPDYSDKMRRVFSDGGRMCVAARSEVVLGVAVYRVFEDTMGGRQLFVDDLVTESSERSTGVGQALLSHLDEVARSAGCWVLTLDSGTQRHRAHKFYFREGMQIVSLHFAKELKRD